MIPGARETHFSLRAGSTAYPIQEYRSYGFKIMSSRSDAVEQDIVSNLCAGTGFSRAEWPMITLYEPLQEEVEYHKLLLLFTMGGSTDSSRQKTTVTLRLSKGIKQAKSDQLEEKFLVALA